MELKVGDIFTSQADWKVVPVNCVGVMGKGLALTFKNKYPDMYQAYRGACQRGELKIGKVWAWDKDKIFCFPTKQDWRNPSRLEWIRDGLQDFTEVYKSLGITSVAFPLLGCGLGGLSKKEVVTLMSSYLFPETDLESELWIPVTNGNQ